MPEKGEIYSTLNMEDITDADYMHTKSNFMVGQCRKSCHDVVLSGLKIFLNLIKALWKVVMKKFMKNAFLKFMFNILKNNITFTIIHQFYLENENENWISPKTCG